MHQQVARGVVLACAVCGHSRTSTGGQVVCAGSRVCFHSYYSIVGQGSVWQTKRMPCCCDVSITMTQEVGCGEARHDNRFGLLATDGSAGGKVSLAVAPDICSMHQKRITPHSTESLAVASVQKPKPYTAVCAQRRQLDSKIAM